MKQKPFAKFLAICLVFVGSTSLVKTTNADVNVNEALLDSCMKRLIPLPTHGVKASGGFYLEGIPSNLRENWEGFLGKEPNQNYPTKGGVKGYFTDYKWTQQGDLHVILPVTQNGSWAEEPNYAKRFVNEENKNASGDAEVKLLGYAAELSFRLEKQNFSKGELLMCSTRGPCKSCRSVIGRVYRDQYNPGIKKLTFNVCYPGDEKTTGKGQGAATGGVDGYDDAEQVEVGNSKYWCKTVGEPRR